jgi:probable HAF family extracellular repeat protein
VSGVVVVGASSAADGGEHAFAYDLGATTPAIQDLGTLGGTRSGASAVGGEIVAGWSYITGDTLQHAFAYDLGASAPVMEDLGTLGGSRSYAAAVSGEVVVGLASTAAGETHAVAWDLSAPTTAATTTTIASSSNPAVIGEQVTYTATVTPVPDGGTVEFMDGASTILGCGSQTVDTSTGEATCHVTYPSPGTHSISAAYSGGPAFDASTSSALEQDIAYGVELVYNTTKDNKGKSVQIKLQLVDSAGTNRSAASVAVTVTGISPSPAPGSAPTGPFTFVSSKKSSEYQLKITTTGYPSGAYTLSFTAGADPTTHTAPFVVA